MGLRAFLVGLLLASEAFGADIPAAGRLESTVSPGTCSASLIASDIIVTAAHCAGSAANPARRFRTGDGIETHAFALAQVARHPFYDPAEPNAAVRLRFDVAAIRLAEPVPDWVARPFDIGHPARVGETLFLVSWRRADGVRPRQRSCKVIEGMRGVVTLACEVRGGESGAPVLRKVDDGLELVAVISSRSRLGGQPVALASDARLRVPPMLDLLD